MADTSQPVLDTTVGSLLRDAAADSPDGLALVEGIEDPSARRSWTFAALLADAERVARALAHRFDKGERVAVWAPNIAEWVLMEYGCALAGVVLVTVNPAFKAQELKYVLGRSRASGVFYLPHFRGNSMAGHLEAFLPELPDRREVVSFGDFEDWICLLPPPPWGHEQRPDGPPSARRFVDSASAGHRTCRQSAAVEGRADR